VLGVALGLLLGLIGLVASQQLLVWVGAAPIVAYSLGVIMASLMLKGSANRILLLVVFPVMHLSWGLGFLLGRAKS